MIEPRDGRWELRLLGGPSLRRGDCVVTRFYSRKTAELLAYLASHPGQEHPREALAELLWPRSAPHAARTNLRVAVSWLRRLLALPGSDAPDPLPAGRAGIRLAPSAVWLDAAAFEARLQGAASTSDPLERLHLLRAAVELYVDDYLPGSYEDWVLIERERLGDAYVAALRQLVRLTTQQKQVQQAIGYAYRLLAREPLDQGVCRAMIQLCAAIGRREEALGHYERLRQGLRDHHQAGPSEATRRVAAQLLGVPGETLDAASPDPAPEPAAQTPGPPDGRAPLPAPLTRFFGRQDELSRLDAILGSGERRLVTLTGPGGVGKTRLAVEWARRLQRSSAEKACFLALADTRSPEQLTSAIARAVGVTLAGGAEPVDQVVAALGDAPLLLVLDNFEQLVEGGAELVHALLSRAPGLTCLVTSRRALHLPGEQEVPVAPLATPARPGTPERLAEFACVRLFVDRAQLVRSGFSVTPHNAAAVVAVCQKLEGIPLAVELAAARAGTETPAGMLAGLADRFALLTTDRRSIPARYQSLRAALDWSYDLLPGDLRRLFARLSVFRGGWTVEAATQVCGGYRIAERLTRLSEWSLVAAEEAPEGLRFRCLETLREYAASRLRRPEAANIAARHAGYYAALAEQGERELLAGEQAAWFERLEAEHANFRAALDWSVGRDGVLALRLSAALWRFWYMHGYLQEGRSRLESALAAGGEPTPELRARALNGAGAVAWSQSDLAAARRFHEEALQIRRAAGDPRATAASLANLGLVRRDEGDLAGARKALQEALVAFRAAGDASSLCAALNGLSSVLLDLGEPAAAEPLLRECLQSARANRNVYAESVALHNLGDVALSRRDPSQAWALFREGLLLRDRLGDRSHMPTALANLGLAALALGRRELAATLLGASEALGEAAGVAPHTRDRRDIQQAVEALSASLGPQDLDRLLREGRVMTAEDALRRVASLPLLSQTPGS